MKTIRDIIIAGLLIALAGALYFFVSNNDGTSSDFDTETATTTSEDLEEAPYVGVELFLAEETENYEVTLELPDEESLYGGEVRNFFIRYADDFKRDAEKAMSQIQAEGSVLFRYGLDVITRTFVTDATVSYVVYSGEYTGGANANSVVFTFVYELKTGKRLVLSDVIPSDERTSFVTAVQKEVHNKTGIEGDGIFSEVIDELKFEDIRNFYIADDGLHIAFSKYEVAPGAAGIVDVVVR